MVTGIRIPKPGGAAKSTFLKFGARKYLAISIVMVAAVLETNHDGTIARARIAVGACSEVAMRLHDLEASLAGQPVSSDLGDMVVAQHVAALTPIADIRGGAEFRLDAALTLVRRALNELGIGA